MKKALLSLAVIAASGGYVAFENANPQAGSGVLIGSATINAQPQTAVPASYTPKVTQPEPKPLPAAVATPPVRLVTASRTQPTTSPAQPAQPAAMVTSPAPPPLPRPRPSNFPSATTAIQVAQSGPQDGTFRGPSVNAYYGRVQVAAVIKSGRLQKIDILQHPYDRRRSQYINSVALPMLEQEAIQAQSANINIISGATLTSEAFIRSLSAALPSARG